MGTPIDSGLTESAKEVRVGGRVASRFDVLERLGFGGLTECFDVQAEDGERAVARRLLARWHGTEVEQAFRDGRGTSRLGFDSATCTEIRAFGEPLSHRLGAADLGFEEAAWWALKAARAAISTEDHGGLRPENCLLVTDILWVDPCYHLDSLSLSAAPYLAPELRQDGAVASAAGDVYAVAMCVVACLSRRGLSLAVLRGLDLGALPVGEPVRQVLKGATDFEPDHRPGMAVLVAHLEEDVDLLDAAANWAAQIGDVSDESRWRSLRLERLDDGTCGDWQELAEAHVRAERWPDAAEAWERSLKRATRRAERVACLRGLLTAVEQVEGPEQAVQRIAAEALLLKPVASEVLVELARRRPDSEAWTRVLEHHLVPAEACEALSQLAAIACRVEDWPSWVERSGQLLEHLVEPQARIEQMLALGRVCMDELGERANALSWLSSAAALGGRSDDLVPRLLELRASRGEWRQVVSLMLEQAEHVDDAEGVVRMLEAAQIAIHAQHHPEEAAAIYRRVLLRDPVNRQALRFLARFHTAAGRDERALALYTRLAPHEARAHPGETTETRVADNIDYARLLLRSDRPRGAQLCVEAALDLAPYHIPTLELASSLSFELGKWDEARVATAGWLRAFSTAEIESDRVHAWCRLGDVAWFEGDLGAASDAYARVLEADPENAAGWWGQAKISLTSHHDRHARTLDPARPWWFAPPARLTPHEMLARLLSAVIEVEALERWMALDPMGSAMLASLVGREARVGAAVDLLCVRQRIDRTFFERLVAARPSWKRAVLTVANAWLSGKAPPDALDCYHWSPSFMPFDISYPRDFASGTLPTPVRPLRPSLAALHHPSAWEVLLRVDGVLSGPPATVGAQDEVIPTSASHGRIRFILDGRSEGPGLDVVDGTVVGTRSVPVPVAGLEEEHARFLLRGEYVYIVAIGPVEVDGQPITQRRLFGGESIRFGPLRAQYEVESEAASSDLRVERVGAEGRTALFLRHAGLEHMVPVRSVELYLGDTPDGGLQWCPPEQARWRVVRVDDRCRLDALEGGRVRWLALGEEAEIDGIRVAYQDLDTLERQPLLGVPFLHFDDGSALGWRLPMSDGMTLGRGRAATFQLASEVFMSRVHCRFDVVDDDVWVEDLESASGTWINGLRTQGRQALSSGDVLTLGQTTMTFGRVDPLLPETSLPVDEPTDTLPVVRERRVGVPVDEGLEKVRLVNAVLSQVEQVVTSKGGMGAGRAYIETLLAARPRSYQGLLDGLEVDGGLPSMPLVYAISRRPPMEQRPLFNFVLRDLLDRAVDGAAGVLEEDALEGLLGELARMRYRELLRF